MGCICTKQQIKYDDPAVLAAETCFNEAEIEALHELFRKLSSALKDDGLISKEEFQLGLFRNSKNQSLFSDRIFQLLDSKHDGVIEFAEFVRSLSVFHPEAPQSDKAAFAFKLYDIWETGFIERDEVKVLILAFLDELELMLSDELLKPLLTRHLRTWILKGMERLIRRSGTNSQHDNSIFEVGDCFITLKRKRGRHFLFILAERSSQDNLAEFQACVGWRSQLHPRSDIEGDINK